MNQRAIRHILLILWAILIGPFKSVAADAVSIKSYVGFNLDSNEDEIRQHVQTILRSSTPSNFFANTDKVYHSALASGNDTLLYKCLKLQQHVHHCSSNYELLLLKSLEALRISHRINSTGLIVKDHCWLTKAHLGMGNLEKAISEANVAKAIAEKSKDGQIVCSALINHASLMIAMHNYEEARKSADGALQLTQALGFSHEQCSILNTLAHIELKLNKPEASALLAHKASLLLNNETNNLDARINNLMLIASSALQLGNNKKAALHIAQAHELAKRNHTFDLLPSILKIRMAVAKDKQDYKMALRYAQEANLLEKNSAQLHFETKLTSLLDHHKHQAADAEQKRLETLKSLHNRHLTEKEKANNVLWMVAASLLVLSGIVLFMFYKTHRLRKWIKLKETQIAQQNDILSEKQLEIEHKNVILGDTIQGQEKSQKDLLRLQKAFRHSVTVYYKTAAIIAEEVLDCTPEIKKQFTNRMANISRTVQHAFKDSMNSKASWNDMIRGIIEEKASLYVGSNSVPRIDLTINVSEAKQQNRFRLGMILHELISISFSSIPLAQRIEFICVTLTESADSALHVQYYTNCDPFEVNQVPADCSIARGVLRKLTNEMGARTQILKDDYRRFELILERIEEQKQKRA